MPLITVAAGKTDEVDDVATGMTGRITPAVAEPLILPDDVQRAHGAIELKVIAAVFL